MSVSPLLQRVWAKVAGGNLGTFGRLHIFRFRSSQSSKQPICAAAVRCHDDPCLVETRWEGVTGTATYPGVWLRDNCQCPQCFHPTTRSRTVLMRHLDPDMKPADVKVEQSKQQLTVTWADGHVSPFPFAWLWRRRPLTGKMSDRRSALRERPAQLWGSELNDKVPTDTLQNIVNDDHALYRWICAMEEIGLFVITDTADRTAVEKLGQRVAFLRKTNYGEHFAVKTKRDPSNLAYTGATLGLHGDLPYYVYTPGVQMLQCLKQTETEGGANEFADGFHVAEQLRQTKPEIFRLLTTLPVEFYDIGNDYYKFHKLDSKPTISLSSEGKVTCINYNNAVRDTFPTVPLDKIRPLYTALRAFDDLLYHPDNLVQFKMAEGDMVCFHNYRVLHGRTGFTMRSEGERELRGGYIDWDELRSRRRVLQEELGLDDMD